MTILTTSQARSMLYRLVDETSSTHEPIIITGIRHNAVLISEEDWKAIQATLELSSNPKLRKSILKGKKEPIKNCVKDLDW